MTLESARRADFHNEADLSLVDILLLSFGREGYATGSLVRSLINREQHLVVGNLKVGEIAEFVEDFLFCVRFGGFF